MGPTVILPTAAFGVGQGAFAPAVVLTAIELGASLATASLVVAGAGVGLILGDVPAGALVARFGELRAMLLATVLVVAALLVCVAADDLVIFAVGVAATGSASAVWGVARQVYVTDVVPVPMRARALSTLAGSRRIGTFVGPFCGAAAISVVGVDGGTWVHVGAAVLAATLMLVVPAVEGPAGSAARRHPGGTVAVIRESASVLSTLGVAVVLVGAVRASRQAFLPLWGTAIDLDPATISVVFGLSGAVDMLLFYPAGAAMDRFGRRWVAVPSMVVLALAHAVLPFVTDLTGLLVVAVLMGLGNGMSSGIIMTLGADVSPVLGRAQFLGVWRLCTDVGGGAGPLLIGGVLVVASLPAAALALAGCSALGALALQRWIPPMSR